MDGVNAGVSIGSVMYGVLGEEGRSLQSSSRFGRERGQQQDIRVGNFVADAGIVDPCATV